jgi:hypothetical protein
MSTRQCFDGSSANLTAKTAFTKEVLLKSQPTLTSVSGNNTGTNFFNAKDKVNLLQKVASLQRSSTA